MQFEIIGDIEHVETFATGRAMRELSRLNKIYGKGRWRKRKGEATIKLAEGREYRAEVHWYEATGIGKRECKIKRLLEKP